MRTKTVKLSKIKIRAEVQAREELDEEIVEDYMEKMKAGVQFPPLIVFSKGSKGAKLILGDGFHRAEAAKRAGIDSIEVEVRKGGIRSAIFFAVGANATHGARRTNADKRKAVNMLLELLKETGKKWSDGKIAEKCAVSQPFVSKIRRELTHNDYESTHKRKGRDKRTINTSKIGKKPIKKEAGNKKGNEKAPKSGKAKANSSKKPTKSLDTLVEAATSFLESAGVLLKRPRAFAKAAQNPGTMSEFESTMNELMEAIVALMDLQDQVSK